MSASLGRMVGDYRGLVETCRQRAIELQISRAEIDRIGGLPAGYAGKLLGRSNKRMWPIGLEAMLGTLGLRILIIEDEAATARTLSLRQPVDRANQRFNNSCNSPLRLAGPQKVDPPPPPMPASSANVIGLRRGGKYG